MGNTFVSGSLVIALASIFCTGFTVLLAHCFRLKCSEINLCGMIFKRDILGENQGYEIELERRTQDTIPPPTIPQSRRGSLNV